MGLGAAQMATSVHFVRATKQLDSKAKTVRDERRVAKRDSVISVDADDAGNHPSGGRRSYGA